MLPIKRIEIVVDSTTATKLLEKLDHIGLRHYTVIKGVFGRGERGNRGGDPFEGTFDNSYILLAVAPDAADRAVEVIGPFLQSYGGICLLSDAALIAHLPDRFTS